ncbi:MAG: glycosyltransferase [Bacilli bacterium]|nr:glycosyltransferase [Bacilli bacterium]
MKKKLLFTAYNLDIGGIEKSLINLLDHINYDKYEVTLILEKKEGIFLDKLNKNVILKELKVSSSKNIILRKMINFYRKLIFKLKNNNKYDFSCCYATYSYSCSKLALIGSKNSALYVHSDYTNLYNKEQYLEFFNTRNIDKFKHIIFVSNESKKSFLKYYPNLDKKTLVFNNFVDTNDIIRKSKEKTELTKQKNKKLLVFIGRLDDSSKKLFRAINLVKNINDLYLWIIGDGPDKEKYVDKVKTENLNNRIVFLGQKNNPYNYLNQADYLILTSDYEGFPVTFLEAIVLNKKIITTIDVSDEIIQIGKNYGYIISKDENKMIEEVKNILKEDKKTKTVDFDKIQEERMKNLEKIFDEVI